MAAGLPDLVDCTHLAEEAAVLKRTYRLRDLPRLKDVLAEPAGSIDASFAFSKMPSGRAGAHVAISAAPVLTCQRCMQGFALPISGGSDVEFTSDEAGTASDEDHELVHAAGGRVSLRELAEEELLLALPFAPACDTPLTCGRAEGLEADAEEPKESDELRRPFSALQDLLKKDRT
jgi:uncharacterized protein